MIGFVELYLFPCAYKSLFGIECPMCGFQRSFLALLKGDFKQSFQLYPSLVPLLSFVIILVLHFAYKEKINRKFVFHCFIMVLLMIFLSYIQKVLLN